MIAKRINSHLSSPFHKLVNDILDRNNLSIIKQDIDLIRLKNNKISSIIELKTGKWSNKDWKPFIKENYPFWRKQTDDANYLALSKLCELLNCDLFVMRTENKSLKNGVKSYHIKLPYNNQASDFKKIKTSQNLLDFVNSHKIVSNTHLNKRKPIINVKDNENNNFDKKNNFYNFINSSILKSQYYLEREGAWTMLISDSKTYLPNCIYIEINENIFNVDISSWNDEFFPIIEISNHLSIPLSLISIKYETINIKSINVYEFNNGHFVFNNDVDLNRFENFYINLVDWAEWINK